MAGRKTPMTDAHKAKLAEGRGLSRPVRDYLEALDGNRPKRGRKRTPDSINARLEVITQQLPEASIMKKVEMVQERRNLEVELATMGATIDLTELEAGFVAAAKTYSARKGISYAAWREIGVTAEVLKKAGITRGA